LCVPMANGPSFACAYLATSPSDQGARGARSTLTHSSAIDQLERNPRRVALRPTIQRLIGWNATPGHVAKRFGPLPRVRLFRRRANESEVLLTGPDRKSRPHQCRCCYSLRSKAQYTDLATGSKISLLRARSSARVPQRLSPQPASHHPANRCPNG
jgi:hypothetical protein